ncbi:MAG: glycosyltransferase [Coriobacteriia bacterium]|nr:glycosyltransferase [Coriobacteriia bacterium]
MSSRAETPALVSVIVPFHNDGATLERCLDSLLHQTWRSLEIIVVDDGSDGPSKQLVADLLASYKDERLRLHVHPYNQGLACTRNTGLSQATGEWVAFVDADDWVEPGFIKALVTAARQDDADIACCRFAVSQLDLEGKQSGQSVSDEGGRELYGQSLGDHPALLNAATLSMNNKLFLRKLFDEQDICFPVGRDFEDLATCPRLMLRARRIVLADVALYHYIQRPVHSLMSRYDSSYLQVIASLREVSADWQQQGASPELMRALSSLSCRILLIDRLYPFFRFADGPVTRAYLDAAFCYLDERAKGWRPEVRQGAVLPSEGLKARLLGLIMTHEHLLRLYATFLRLKYRTERSALAAGGRS